MAEKSKTDVRRAAAERAATLRAQQLKQEKRNRLMTIIGLVVAVVVIMGAVLFIMGQDGKDPLDGVKAPANTSQGGISFGASGTPGSSNPNTPTLEIFVDYGCVYCAQLEVTNADDLTELATSGDATVVFKPVVITAQPNAQYPVRAANAAAIVLQYEPEKFLAFHNELFTRFDELRGADASYPDIVAVALSVGVSPQTADLFQGEEFSEWVQAATKRAQRIDKLSGTPTVHLNGEPMSVSWSTPGLLAATVREAAAADSGIAPQE